MIIPVAGYVSVINGGKETNKRMLNVWEISLLYKQPDEGIYPQRSKV